MTSILKQNIAAVKIFSSPFSPVFGHCELAALRRNNNVSFTAASTGIQGKMFIMSLGIWQALRSNIYLLFSHTHYAYILMQAFFLMQVLKGLITSISERPCT